MEDHFLPSDDIFSEVNITYEHLLFKHQYCAHRLQHILEVALASNKDDSKCEIIEKILECKTYHEEIKQKMQQIVNENRLPILKLEGGVEQTVDDFVASQAYLDKMNDYKKIESIFENGWQPVEAQTTEL